jgi:hypothetical protein
MFIASPRPIEGSAPKDPLNADGSNFPCHGVALPVRGGQQLTAGSSFELKLDIGAGGENNAVHGGGSCQLAVTYETTAEKIRDPNNWHVVYSIQGGCPANAAGNLDKAVYCEAAGQSECINTWDVPLPKGLRSGHAILSWTWFNVIGKREMYQNCANINIIGGTGEDMGSFPSMYVANIGHGDVCTSAPERTNVAFPIPGEFHTTMSRSDGEDWPYTTANCSLGGPNHLSYRTKNLGPSISPIPVESATSSIPPFQSYGPPDSGALHRLATAAIVTSPTNSRSWGTSAPTGGSDSAVHGEEKPSVEAYESYDLTDHVRNQVPQLHSPSGCTVISSPSEHTLDSCPTSKVACSREATVVCIGDHEFGLCYEGCAIPQPLALGTSCGMHGIVRG